MTCCFFIPLFSAKWLILSKCLGNLFYGVISVVYINPDYWEKIIESHRRIEANTNDDAAWAQLAMSYYYIGYITVHYRTYDRMKDYYDLAHSTRAIALKEEVVR